MKLKRTGFFANDSKLGIASVTLDWFFEVVSAMMAP
jgi:hypothetical protein